MKRFIPVFALFAGCLCLLSAEAFASHYLLEDLPFVTAEERTALEARGILASEELLERVATPAGRAKLSRETGIDKARMLALADKVDLLQVRGIGPSMVRLLQLAGVPHGSALAAMKADALHAAVVEANSREHVSPKIPSIEMLADWVRQARGAPVKIRRP